jgi:beta-lactam-binding protein with PASTA domain
VVGGHTAAHHDHRRNGMTLRPARIGVGALVMLALIGSLAVRAQSVDCARLPAAERDAARQAGRCVDPALRVPNVVGLEYPAAAAALRRFNVERSYRAAPEPGGQVLAQDPAPPATLPAGATVSVVVSDGTLVRVPALVGQTLDAARRRLAEIELKLQAAVVSSESPAGRVMEQQPAAGALVRRGSNVRLQVSAGPAAVKMPQVVGLPQSDALARLTPFKVERIEATHTAPLGQVVAQQPGAGALVRAGAPVSITVSSGQETIEVPDVVGSAVDAAQDRLAEFTVQVSRAAGAAPAERVLAQDPAAGALRPFGAPVALSISDGTLTALGGASSIDRNGDGLQRVHWVLLAAAGAALLIAGGIVGRSWLKPRLVTVHVTARFDPPESPAVTEVAAQGPTISIAGKLQRGESTVKSSETT